MRPIGSTNETEVEGAHVQTVLLANFQFDEPVYLHSGIGEIVYDSNTYLGVGHFGGISAARETEVLSATRIVFSLSGVSPVNFAEALDAGNYGDVMTVYEGYRQDDGTLVADPWVLWSGTFEYAQISQGQEDSVEITAQHDLAVLEEKDNSRFTDEDQVQRFSGDRIFEYITDQQSVKLTWGRRPSGRPTLT